MQTKQKKKHPAMAGARIHNRGAAGSLLYIFVLGVTESFDLVRNLELV